MSAHLDAVGKIQAAWRRERPDVDVHPQGIIGRLHRLAAHLSKDLDAVFAQHNLTEGEFDVLATLRRAGAPFERTPSELAEHTMVTTGATSKRIDRLVEAGLIERRLSDQDGRSRIIALTERGLAAVDAAFTDHMVNEHRILSQLSTQEQTQLESILTTWLGQYEGDSSARAHSKRGGEDHPA